MNGEYAHGLAADWKQRSAMASASKVGGAYEGYQFKEPLFSGRIRSSWWLVAAGAVVVIVARGIGI